MASIDDISSLIISYNTSILKKMKRSIQYYSIRAFILDEIKLEALKYKEIMRETINKIKKLT